MKQRRVTNYARCIFTGYYVFFDDRTPPKFPFPQLWAYWRVPTGQDPDTFQGRLVGVNSSEQEPASDPEAPTAASA